MKRISLIFAMCLLTSFAFAQTVTVDASLASPDNTTNFSSLQVAISSFQASGDVTAGTDGSGVGKNHGNAAADVINVVATTKVDEWVVVDNLATATGGTKVVLDEPMTIQGSGGNAVICLQMRSTATTGFNDCGFCWRQDVNLTLKDLIFIPSKTATPTDDGMYFLQSANSTDPVVTMDNIVVTANNGSDAPVTTTGLDTPDLTGATLFGDDGITFLSRTEGGSYTLNATNLVVSSWNTSTASGRDAILVYMNGATADKINAFLNLGEGSVISNVLRFGIQNPYGGFVKVQGTHDNPVIFANINGDAIWNFSDAAAPTQPTACEVENAIFVNINGSAVKEQETDGRGFIKSVKNSIIANCTAPGIEFYADGALPTDTGLGVTDTVAIENVTLYNCGYGQLDPGTSYDFRFACIASPTYTGPEKSNRNVNIKNSILAGGGVTGIYNSSAGTYTVDYSALVTSHTFGEALGAATAGPSTITVGANVINASPIFSQIADFTDSAYFDVRNPDFGGAAEGGADLAGGADFIGDYVPPASAQSFWALYE